MQFVDSFIKIENTQFGCISVFQIPFSVINTTMIIVVRGAKTISKATNRTTNDRLEAEQPTQLRKGSRDL